MRAQSVPASKKPLAGMELDSEYRISSGDKLSIFVWQNPDLTSDVLVGPDGKISYPLVGTVTAAGLTVPELEAKLKERLSEYIKFVQVNVSIKDFAVNKVVVLGEVVYPGVYTFSGTNIDIMEAIGLAGDFTNGAKRESVIVVSDNLTPNPKVRRVNVFMALRRGTVDPNAVINSGDVVYIPRRFITDFNQFLNDLGPSISTFAGIFGAQGVASLSKAWFWHREVNVKPADGN